MHNNNCKLPEIYPSPPLGAITTETWQIRVHTITISLYYNLSLLHGVTIYFTFLNILESSIITITLEYQVWKLIITTKLMMMTWISYPCKMEVIKAIIWDVSF